MADLIGKLGDALTAMGELVVPRLCFVCQVPLDDGRELLLCDDCQAALTNSRGIACSACGAWRDPRHRAGDCACCRHLDTGADSVCSLGNYTGLLRELVLRMKTRGQETLAIQLGRWLGIRLRQAGGPLPEMIVPLPAWWLRRMQRGYNVAELLSDGVAAVLPDRVPCVQALRLARPVKKQAMLTTRQRYANVKNCFSIREAPVIASKQLLLVDDVMTSGATASQAIRTLRRAGAASVCLAVVARGVGRQTD